MSNELFFELNGFPGETELGPLWLAAWDEPLRPGYAEMLRRGLCHGAARVAAGGMLIGFVNVATDGGIHAFILDTTVDPGFRHQGVGTRLVQLAADEARRRGAIWLHVDFEPHLAAFYRGCGFQPSAAGVMRLA